MMAQLLDKDSVPSATSLVDLFTVPSTQAVIDHSYWYAAHPVNTVTSDGPYQFTVSSGPDYVHLGKNYLYMKLQILQPDDKSTTTTQKVAPINLIGKTFFKQVKLALNGKLAFDSGPMYAYRSYLETELNYNGEAKGNTLAAALYAKESSDPEKATDKGFVAREQKVSTSKIFELMAPIHCDLFLTDRLMISNTHLQLELHRNSDKFCLQSFDAAAQDYKIKGL